MTCSRSFFCSFIRRTTSVSETCNPNLHCTLYGDNKHEATTATSRFLRLKKVLSLLLVKFCFRIHDRGRKANKGRKGQGLLASSCGHLEVAHIRSGGIATQVRIGLSFWGKLSSNFIFVPTSLATCSWELSSEARNVGGCLTMHWHMQMWVW